MVDGTAKPISEVEAGDEVLAYDPTTGEGGPRKVTRVWIHKDEVVALEVKGERIVTTEDHPFWNESLRRWQRADGFTKGDALLASDGTPVPFGGLARVSDSRDVYILTVAAIHTYYVVVGGTPILVHNSGGDDIGLSREQHVADLVGGSLAKDARGQDIRVKMPNVGATGIDVSRAQRGVHLRRRSSESEEPC
ncbi:Hint domain-containing protein [Micromonospora matsumotoense]|uniref:Hint domain-containing protein n=1 Tax=Micromonospora matsumotoense TaxID=121616 RepID=UPI0033E382B8